jgi:peptidyl-prolyl cis-trans isomerase SurA
MNRVAFLALMSLAAVPARAQDTARVQHIPVDRVVAVVGNTPILWSDVLVVVDQRRAGGVRMPEDSVGQMNYARQVIQELAEEELLVQRALADTGIVVADADLTQTVEDQVKRLRGNFRTDQEYLTALRNAGFGNQEEYRRWLTEQARRRELQQRLVAKMQREGRMIPVAVSDEEITEAYEREKTRLPKRPPAVTFRQIVVATAASEQARSLARAKAESLLAEIRRGSEFEQIARRESMDPETKEQGGDLGWNRRDQMVPEFDRMMFSLAPGQVSPVVETQYGFHIIKVDRVKPSEVKARHILVKPAFDSTDIARARARADSVLRLWQTGTPYDTLVRLFHDRDELEGSLEPFPRSQLPPSYATAFEGTKKADYAGPFPIDDPRRGVPKFVVAQITDVILEGEYTVQELREQIRASLAQERAFRRLIDLLKKETHVAILPMDGSVAIRK